MCQCAWTTTDILELLNKKREKNGLAPVNYGWMMVQHRDKIRSLEPDRKIGNNLVWDARAARKIVAALENVPYSKVMFNYRDYNAGRCDEQGHPRAA